MNRLVDEHLAIGADELHVELGFEYVRHTAQVYRTMKGVTYSWRLYQYGRECTEDIIATERLAKRYGAAGEGGGSRPRDLERDVSYRGELRQGVDDLSHTGELGARSTLRGEGSVQVDRCRPRGNLQPQNLGADRNGARQARSALSGVGPAHERRKCGGADGAGN